MSASKLAKLELVKNLNKIPPAPQAATATVAYSALMAPTSLFSWRAIEMIRLMITFL
jgi:hypothetical protein